MYKIIHKKQIYSYSTDNDDHAKKKLACSTKYLEKKQRQIVKTLLKKLCMKNYVSKLKSLVILYINTVLLYPVNILSFSIALKSIYFKSLCSSAQSGECMEGKYFLKNKKISKELKEKVNKKKNR